MMDGSTSFELRTAGGAEILWVYPVVLPIQPGLNLLIPAHRAGRHLRKITGKEGKLRQARLHHAHLPVAVQQIPRKLQRIIFRNPFFATTIQEFWQRWHITLGTWLKDYIMDPVLKSDCWVRLGEVSRKKMSAAAET